MPRTQEHRTIAVGTPLGDDKVFIKSFAATEELGRPFRFELELLSDDGSIDPLKILGERVTVRVESPDGDEETRYFNGHVSRWQQTTPSGGMSRYFATLVPWAWFLSRTADCRIFQGLSVPDIVQKVFRDHGFSDFAAELNGTYEPVEYCVQYRETAFNFVSRLMEQVGIYYYFRHENGKHTMVLADSAATHEGVGPLQYHPPDRVSVGRDFITDFSVERRVQTGEFTHTDFNFTMPGTNLEAKSRATDSYTGSEHPLFDYPGEYAKSEDGQALARVRMEEIQTEHEIAQGETDAHLVTVGKKFTLKEFPREDWCKDWLVTSSTIHAESDQFQGGGAAGSAPMYRCSFTGIDAKKQYRAARVTPKPLVSGPQTAIVVGKSGEEIWTDEYGRVKVLFHWDRGGTADETTSCWLRVSQAWAGKGFGAMFIPRIGHEVIVEFLEGDPDRPIVTGCVYNAREMPAYALPDEATKSGVKTDTTKGGGGFNEIRFEDKKGEEQLFIHAQKQLDLRVTKDAVEWVGKDRHLIVVENEFIEVKKNRSVKVAENCSEEVTMDHSLTIKGKNAVKITGQNSLTVDGAMVEVFKGGHSEATTGNYYLKASGGLVIECPAGITLVCGGSSVVIDASGVTLKGPTVTLDGGMTKINSGPGSSPASGSAGSADDPAAPEAPLEAAKADPGEQSEVAARNSEVWKMRSQTAEVAGVAAPPGQEQPQEEQKTWYELEVIDAASKPVKNEPVIVHLKDGTKLDKKTDGRGIVRMDNVHHGEVVDYQLPKREDEEWKSLGAGGHRSKGGESGGGGSGGSAGGSGTSERENLAMEESGGSGGGHTEYDESELDSGSGGGGGGGPEEEAGGGGGGGGGPEEEAGGGGGGGGGPEEEAGGGGGGYSEP